MTVEAFDVPTVRKVRWTNLLVRYGLAGLLLALILIFTAIQPSFLNEGDAVGLVRSASVTMIMFLGLTWVLAAGEIDISFVSVAALANMLVAGLVAAGHGWLLASVLALGCSLVFGLFNGLLVAYLGLPALVVTIATGGIAAALADAIGRGSSIEISTTGFVGHIVTAQLGFAPLIAVIAVIIYAAAWFAQDRLLWGHYIYALAQNRRAVIEAGVPAKRLLGLLFTGSSLSSGVAGILLAADLSSGQPSIASSMFLDGLTAVLLGGVMIKLGKPNVIGTAVSVLILAVLVRGGALLGLADSEFQIIKGGLLLLGVTVVIWARES
jgi:ribose/xylose/arabinose/galactoside ABC-type transport system permease subunit